MKFLKWFAFIVYWPLAWVIGGIGCFALAFSSVNASAYIIAWICFLLGLGIALSRLVWRKKWLLRIGLGIAAIAVLSAGGVSVREWWARGRFDVLREGIVWSDYYPFEPDNKLVKTDCPPEFRFEGQAPKVVCALALYPIGAAAFEAQGTRETVPNSAILPCSSPYAYNSLLEASWSSDAILALAPSDDQRRLAKEKGLDYELTPIAKDAFVFFVSKDNPVEGLTSQQIRDIYSGKITSWRELGVNLGAELVPYQRNEGSGSQTALERLMWDTPIIPPPQENRIGDMGGIITATADYRDRPGALGFSFRYYSTELVRNGKIKLLAIDGIPPTVENIRSGAYPFVETAYAITVKPRKGNTKKFIDFLASPAGRDLVERTGYVAP